MQAASLDNMAARGAVSIDAGKLAAVAAAALGLPAVDLISASTAELPFPTFNMTTGGLWRAKGTARASCPNAGGRGTAARFSTVVKLIQSPLLWSGINQVPLHLRDDLVSHYPWRTEATVYSSSLSGAMPAGGRLPKVYTIEELDPQRTAIWMEDISECPGADWTESRFRHAAALLGRLAGSTAVRELGPRISAERDAQRLRFYLDGLGALMLIPSICGEELWKVPAVAEVATGQLIAGLRSLAARAYELAEEISALPVFPAHGDASPQNLLIESTADGPGGVSNFAVIDWGLYGGACAGFDLGQLLAGWVNQGTMSGEELYRLEPLCLAAYCEGLAESGADVPESLVRRGHAASMALFTGLQAVFTQRLAEPDSEELRGFVAGRVAMARFILDLLASTD